MPTEELTSESIKKAKGKIVGTRRKKGIVVTDHTYWSKKEIEVLAYLVKNKNKPSTYREIARGYVSSSYSTYLMVCKDLVSRGYLMRLKDNTDLPTTYGYKVSDVDWPWVKTGKEIVERSLPYFTKSLKRLEKREKTKFGTS